MTIEQKKSRIRELDVQIDALCDERTSLRKEVEIAKSKYTIGELVQWGRGKITQGKITQIWPTLMASPILKKGNAGKPKRISEMFDNIIKVIEPTPPSDK